MRANAVYKIKINAAKELYQSLLLEELETDSLSNRSDISLKFEEPDTIIIKIESRDPTSLRAATNTWLRLAMTGIGVYESCFSNEIK